MLSSNKDNGAMFTLFVDSLVGSKATSFSVVSKRETFAGSISGFLAGGGK